MVTNNGIFSFRSICVLVTAMTSVLSSCDQKNLNVNEGSDVHRVFASISNDAVSSTRTYVDQWSGPKIFWHECDSIAVIQGDVSGIYQFDGNTGDSQGTFSFIDGYQLEGNPLYSFYPAGAFLWMYDETFFFKLPSHQTYSYDSFSRSSAVMIAKSETDGFASFSFMPVLSYLVVRLYDQDCSWIRKIELKSLSGEIISGTSSVSFDGNGVYSFSLFEGYDDSSDSIVLDCGENGVQLDGIVDFWFVVPPVTLSSGFSITVTDVNGRVFEKSSAAERSFSMNTFNKMAPVECLFVGPDDLVDLGLSVKWATRNLGAADSLASGDMYAWGETETRPSFSDWMDYKYCASLSKAYYNVSKYVFDKTYGTYDNKIVLEASDDAATVTLRGNWRTPTVAEIQELVDPEKCSWTREWDDAGNSYYRVTSLVEGFEGNSIVVPDVSYWSSSLSGDYNLNAYSLDPTPAVSTSSRGQRLYVRPVYGTPKIASGLTLTTWYNMYPYNYRQALGTVPLYVSVHPQGCDSVDVLWTSDNERIATVDQSGEVTLVSPGTTTITASTSDGRLSVKSTVTEYENTRGVQVVDMGLGVKWSDRNIGSSDPIHYGDYFAFGELYSKTYYSVTNYKYFDCSAGLYTKYANDDNYGIRDGKLTLDLEDDVAQKTLGGKFRMPTSEEWKELMDPDKCQWTVVTQNGVRGYQVVSKISGYEGNSLFFPFAGYIEFSFISSEQSMGIYASSTASTDMASWALSASMSEGGMVFMGQGARMHGESVRAVYDDNL